MVYDDDDVDVLGDVEMFMKMFEEGVLARQYDERLTFLTSVIDKGRLQKSDLIASDTVQLDASED